MSIARRLTRLRGPVAFWALAGVALLVSHDAVFLAQVGPGEGLTRALRTAAHEYWGPASLGLVAVALLVLAGAAIRLLALRRSAARFGAPAVSRGSWVARLLATWGRLFAVVAIGFMVQESVEHFVSHGHLLGASALLGPEYPLALPVIGTITLLGSLLGATVARTELTLLEAIADGLRRLRRAPRQLQRPALRLAFVPRPVAGRSSADRAPPVAFVTAG